MTRRKMSNEQWMEMIQTCRSSGLSDHQWCKENDVAVSTFYKHAKEFRENACISLPSFGTRNVHDTQEVVQVNLETKTSALIEHSDPLAIECPAISLHINGIRMDIHNHVDPVLLTKALQALGNLC